MGKNYSREKIVDGDLIIDEQYVKGFVEYAEDFLDSYTIQDFEDEEVLQQHLDDVKVITYTSSRLLMYFEDNYNLSFVNKYSGKISEIQEKIFNLSINQSPDMFAAISKNIKLLKENYKKNTKDTISIFSLLITLLCFILTDMSLFKEGVDSISLEKVAVINISMLLVVLTLFSLISFFFNFKIEKYKIVLFLVAFIVLTLSLILIVKI